MEKFKPFIIPVALLVLIDQMVKIVISKVFMKYEFDIIAKVLRFNSGLNLKVLIIISNSHFINNLEITILIVWSIITNNNIGIMKGLNFFINHNSSQFKFVTFFNIHIITFLYQHHNKILCPDNLIEQL